MRKSLIFNIVAILLAGLYVFNMSNTARETQAARDKEFTRLEKKEKELITEVSELEEYVSKLADTTVSEAQGLDPELKTEDEALISKVLNPVFSWTDGASYDAMRDEMIKNFGADNQFVSTYIAENIKVDVPEGYTGANNDIDLNELSSKIKEMNIYPFSWNENGDIQYSVVVNYQLYKGEAELSADNMKTTYVYIEFKISGNKGERKLTDLKGFDIQE